MVVAAEHKQGDKVTAMVSIRMVSRSKTPRRQGAHFLWCLRCMLSAGLARRQCVAKEGAAHTIPVRTTTAKSLRLRSAAGDSQSMV